MLHLCSNMLFKYILAISSEFLDKCSTSRIF